MKALITGSSGFVGGHLVEHLLSLGDEVSVLDPAVDIRDQQALSVAFCTFVESQVDVIFHLAALSHVGDSFGSSAEVFKVNVMGSVNLLEVARAQFPHAKVVFVSSSEVYGSVSSGDLPVRENAPLAPLSPYAASKAAAEQVALQAFRAYGQQIMIARPFNHIGPGQSENFVVSALARRVLIAKRDRSHSIVVGNLNSRRDFTDVRDVVKAYRKMAEFGTPGSIYNICSGRSVPISVLADTIVNLSGADVVLNRDLLLVRDIEVSDIFGDSSRCKSDLSWLPQIPIEESLKDVLAWWSARLELG